MNGFQNYKDAFTELQGILTEIEKGEISVDELSEKVKRATALIKLCKLKLTTAEVDVNALLKEYSCFIGGKTQSKSPNTFLPNLLT